MEHDNAMIVDVVRTKNLRNIRDLRAHLAGQFRPQIVMTLLAFEMNEIIYSAEDPRSSLTNSQYGPRGVSIVSFY